MYFPNSPQRNRSRTAEQHTPGAQRWGTRAARTRSEPSRTGGRYLSLQQSHFIRKAAHHQTLPEGSGQQIAAGGSQGRQRRAEQQPDPRPEQRSGQNILRRNGVPTAGRGPAARSAAPRRGPTAPYQQAGAGDGEALLVEVGSAEQEHGRPAVPPLVVPQRLAQLPQLLQVRREAQRPNGTHGGNRVAAPTAPPARLPAPTCPSAPRPAEPTAATARPWSPRTPTAARPAAATSRHRDRPGAPRVRSAAALGGSVPTAHGLGLYVCIERSATVWRPRDATALSRPLPPLLLVLLVLLLPAARRKGWV